LDCSLKTGFTINVLPSISYTLGSLESVILQGFGFLYVTFNYSTSRFLCRDKQRGNAKIASPPLFAATSGQVRAVDKGIFSRVI